MSTTMKIMCKLNIFIYTFMHMTFEQLLEKMKDLQVSSHLRKKNGMRGNVWCVSDIPVYKKLSGAILD
jgi:hypothetical protein